MHAALVPSPDFRRDIIEHLDAVLFGKLGYAQVETGVIYQYEYIRLVGQQILLTFFQVATKLKDAGCRFPEAHNGHLLVVMHERTAFRLHHVAAPAPKLGIRILLAQVLHQMRGMKVAGTFASYQVVLQLLLVVWLTN